MLVKKELLEMKVLLATDEIVDLAWDNKLEKPTNKPYGGRTLYRYGMFILYDKNDKYLKAAIFIDKDLRKGFKTPSHEIFIEIATDKYITKYNFGRYKNEVEAAGYKWISTGIDFLQIIPYGHWWDYENVSYSLPVWDKKIRKIFDISKNGYGGIREIQERYRKKKLEERDRKITDPWDKDMELFQEDPKDFMEWAKKDGITENFIFYEFKKGGAKTGHCSYCQKTVTLTEHPYHGQIGKCPECSKKITYKSTGRISTLQTDRAAIQIISHIEGGFLVKIYGAYKRYGDNCSWGHDFKNPEFIIYESERIIYLNGKSVRYNWDNFKQRKMRWVKECEDLLRGTWNYKTTVYPYNFDQIESEVIKHSSMKYMIDKGYNVDPIRWINGEQGNPSIEMLAKIGCYELAQDMLEIKYDKDIILQGETELAKMIMIDAARLKRIKNMEGGIYHLRWMQQEKKTNTIWPDEMIKYFAEFETGPKDLDFIHDRMSYIKIYNYFLKNRINTKEKVNEFLTTWRDYLNMAQKLKMDVTKEMIYKPKCLKDAHSDVVDMLNEADMKKSAAVVAKKYKNANKNCKALKKYEYIGEKFQIIAPTGIIDIFYEGMKLRHCIHTCDFYFDRINKKEAYLVFLRRNENPKTPWYTLEIEPGGNIRQKRTTGDTQKEDLKEAMPFLKQWQKEIQKRLTAEDKALAKKSDEARKQNYEQIRKEKKVVWHGPLAGQLLADVFESDFMEIDIDFEQMPESAAV